MACVKRMDKTLSMAESFCEAKSALEGVFHLYKWGRHANGFPEEVYLLLSHCAYICYYLWWSDQESEGGIFQMSPPPAIFWLDLNFRELGGKEYDGGVVPPDIREDQLKNNTKWFEFWMKILERSDPHVVPIYQQFSRQILAYLGRRDLLEVKVGYRSRKALSLFLKSEEAGRVLLRTIVVLEDTVQAILRYFTTLDPKACVLAKITLLTGLLSEMRQIVIWETPARGPYSPSGDTRWRVWSPLTWLSCDKTPGVLTVIPRREGGEVICTFDPAPDSKGRCASWVRNMMSLKSTYEAALFATWSYDNGAPPANPQQSPGATACWIVQYAEANRLESLSRQIDLLLTALQENPRCKPLVVAVRSVLRNGHRRWKANMLAWTYVKQLDQLHDQLTSVYRQANTLGEDNATAGVIARIWPSEEATTKGGNLPGGHNRQSEKAFPGSASSKEACAPDPGKSTVSLVAPCVQDQPPQASRSPEQPSREPSAGESEPPLFVPVIGSGMKSPTQPAPGTLASLLQRVGGGRTRNDQNAASASPASSALPEEREKAQEVEPVDHRTPGEIPTVGGDPQNDAPVPGESETRESEQGPEPRSSARPTQEIEPEHKSTYPLSAWPAEKNSGPESGSKPAEAGAATEQPDRTVAVGSADSEETDPGGGAVPAPRELFRSRTISVAKAATTDLPSGADDALRQRLLEHHGCLEGTINYEPLSSAALQRDLGWSSSKVQRAMTHLFGAKPVSAYREKCEDRTISTFLKAHAGRENLWRAGP